MPGRLAQPLWFRVQARPIAVLALGLLALVLALPATAATVRVGVLAHGTVSWEIDTLQHHGLDRRHGIDLEVLRLASPQATKVALQAGRVDVIVADWVWVARQRSQGAKLTFAPYSRAVGALMTAPGSGIGGIADLPGARIGVVGGALDKNWLLLRAYAMAQGHDDPAATVTTVYGAPPLMNGQLESGRVDAVLTYWHYAARLAAKGYREVVSVPEMIAGLGIDGEVPILGYVFSADWARANPAAIGGFLAAVRDAKELLAASDAEWARLRPRIRPRSEAELAALRDGFRAGIPAPWQPEQRRGAERLWHILRRLGGADLVGPADDLAPGTFWSGEPS